MKNEKRGASGRRRVSGSILDKGRYRKRRRKKNAVAVFIENTYYAVKRSLSQRSGRGGGKSNKKGRDEIVRVIRDENGTPVRVIRRRHVPVPYETRKKQVIGIVASLVFVWLLFFQIRYEPLKVTEIGDEKLRGRLEKEVVMNGVKGKYLETGKDYDIDIRENFTDIFGKKAYQTVSDDKVSITVKSGAKASDIKTSKNSFRIKNSVTSETGLTLNVTYEDVSTDYSYTVKDNLKHKIDSKGYITNPNEYDAVVNKKRKLSPSYVPKDLVEPNVRFHQGDRSVRKMRKTSAKALEKLFSDAEAKGYEFYAVSGFRTYEMQKLIHQNNVRQYGSEERALQYSAREGHSEHQLGTTMDVSTTEMGYALKTDFGKTRAGRWLYRNAHEYGFIIRYPKGKEHITGYGYEPWHLRYVGKPLAEHLYRKNLTLEEYFEKN